MDVSKIPSKIISAALFRAQNELPDFGLTVEDASTPIFGTPDAVIDSLNLVSFIFILEDEFKKITGKDLKITTENIINSDAPPFQNLKTLEVFLEEKIKSKQ